MYKNLQKVFTAKAISLEAKPFVKNIDLDIRVECLAKTHSLRKFKKNHKLNFMSSHPCGLFNPRNSMQL